MNKYVCKLIVLAVMVLAMCGKGFADVKINEANFPDEIFRSYVSSNCDTDRNGTLSDAEIATVTRVIVNSTNISSLKGIEYFTALTFLECPNNQLTALDVSHNTALTNLVCSYNQLTALDVSHNTALTLLWCYNNQLTALDVSKNTDLTSLYCGNNQLTALDVSKNTALTFLNCSYNQLTALDVSNNTALTSLKCDTNQLTALDVSNNTALTYLDCSSNQLTALDLSNNTNLIDLRCDFTITSADNNFEFNIADFLKAYKSLDNNLRSIDFFYVYTGGSGNLTLAPDIIAASNIVSFTIPEGKNISYIYMVLTYSNSSDKHVYVYPSSGTSSATTDPRLVKRRTHHHNLITPLRLR